MAQLVKVFHDKVLNYSDICKKYLIIILLKIVHIYKIYLNWRLYILKLNKINKTK